MFLGKFGRQVLVDDSVGICELLLNPTEYFR
jgi:hypothetical protein